MISQERVLEVYERANPVKDPESVKANLEAAGYLATLEQRSSEMSQLEIRDDEQEHTKKPRRQWMAAAVAFIAVATGLLFLSRGNDNVAASADIELVQSLVDAWQAHDGEAIASHFSSDGALHLIVVEETWVGREVIAERTAGYSQRHQFKSAFDFTQIGEELVFNLDTYDAMENGDRHLGVVVVIRNGLIESLVFETERTYFCIGDTTSGCIVRETGEYRPPE